MANGPDLWNYILSGLPPSAIIAGGAVRDFQLGVEPKDIDVFIPAPLWSLPEGFYALGHDRADEYAAMREIDVISRGTVEGYQVDLVGVTIEPWSGEALVDTFDFGITQQWFDGEIRFTDAAANDLMDSTVTLLRDDRLTRAEARFERFNARHQDRFTMVRVS